MLNKEEIEKAKDDLMFFNEGDYITREMNKSVDILEEYIKELEQENNKLNKMTDEMINYIEEIDYTGSLCKMECSGDCKPCIKQYFEKKVEEKLNEDNIP